MRNVIGRSEPIVTGPLAECLRSSPVPLSVHVHRLDALRYSIGNLIPWVHKERKLLQFDQFRRLDRSRSAIAPMLHLKKPSRLTAMRGRRVRIAFSGQRLHEFLAHLPALKISRRTCNVTVWYDK